MDSDDEDDENPPVRTTLHRGISIPTDLYLLDDHEKFREQEREELEGLSIALQSATKTKRQKLETFDI
jgi:hypothetical protein